MDTPDYQHLRNARIVRRRPLGSEERQAADLALLAHVPSARPKRAHALRKGVVIADLFVGRRAGSRFSWEPAAFVNECVPIRKISSDFLECSPTPSIEITERKSGRIIAAIAARFLGGKEV